MRREELAREHAPRVDAWMGLEPLRLELALGVREDLAGASDRLAPETEREESLGLGEHHVEPLGRVGRSYGHRGPMVHRGDGVVDPVALPPAERTEEERARSQGRPRTDALEASVRDARCRASIVALTSRAEVG